MGSDPAVTSQPVGEMVAPPPAPEVVAVRASGAMGVPAKDSCVPGLVTDTVLSMVNATTVVPVKPAESVAWTVAE